MSIQQSNNQSVYVPNWPGQLARVVSRTENDPPGVPIMRQAFVVGPLPTTSWVGQEFSYAQWIGGEHQWQFIAPIEGMAVWVDDEDTLYVYNGVEWVPVAIRLGKILAGTTQTTDATPTPIVTYTTQTDSHVIGMRLVVLAYDAGNDLSARFVVEVTAKRDSIGDVTLMDQFLSPAFKVNSNWDVNVIAQTPYLNVWVTGDVGNTVEWSITGEVIEHG